MAFSVIQSNGNIAGNTVVLNGVVAGRLIVLWAKWENSKNNISASDGTSSLAIGTRSDSASADGVMGQFAYLLSANGGNKTYTVTFPGGATVLQVIAFEVSYTGVASLDTQNTGNGNSNAAQSGNITTTAINEIVFGAHGPWSSSQDPSSSEQINDQAADGVIRCASGYPDASCWYKVFAATISGAHAQASLAGGDEWVCNIIAFKAVQPSAALTGTATESITEADIV